MIQSFPESDWQKLRKVRPNALNRLCSRIIAEVETKCHFEKSSKSPHEAYLQIYKFVQDRDKIVAELFDDWRRSTVFFVLCGWLREALLTRTEFDTLSEDTQNSVAAFVNPKFFDEFKD